MGGERAQECFSKALIFSLVDLMWYEREEERAILGKEKKKKVWDRVYTVAGKHQVSQKGTWVATFR